MLTAHRFLLKAEVRCGYVRIYSYNSAQNQRSILKKKNSLYSSDAVYQVRILLLLLYSIVMQLQIRPLHVALLRQDWTPSKQLLWQQLRYLGTFWLCQNDSFGHYSIWRNEVFEIIICCTSYLAWIDTAEWTDDFKTPRQQLTNWSKSVTNYHQRIDQKHRIWNYLPLTMMWPNTMMTRVTESKTASMITMRS